MEKVKGGIRMIPGLSQGHCTHSTKSNQRSMVKQSAKRKALVGLCLTPELNIDTRPVSKRNHYLMLASCTGLRPASLNFNLNTNVAHLKTDLRSAKAAHTTIFPTACVSGFYCQHCYTVFAIETQLKPLNLPWICTKFHWHLIFSNMSVALILASKADWPKRHQSERSIGNKGTADELNSGGWDYMMGLLYMRKREDGTAADYTKEELLFHE